jgi:diacylglycerol kinase family enzyme
MTGIGIITNPHSKLNKRNPQIIQQLQSAIGSDGQVYCTQTLEDLDRIPAQFLQKNHKILVIFGGDGTISRTMSAFIRIYRGANHPLPPVAILKGGTMNLIAAQINQNLSWDKALSKLLEHQADLNRLPRMTLSCIEVEQNFGFLYADGSNVAILEEFYRKKSGVAGACWLAAKLIGSFLRKGPFVKRLIQPSELEVRVGQDPAVVFRTLGNFAGTITKLPLRLPFLTFARDAAECFQVTLVTCNQEKLLWFLPLIMLQKKKGHGLGKFTACCQELMIRATQEIRYTIDGEVYESRDKDLTIKSGPEITFIRLVTPTKESTS